MPIKRLTIYGILLAALIGWASCPPAPAAQPNQTGGASPAVFFPEKVFEFPPVIDGVKVVHDFVVVNRGSAPLTIENVRTG
jgi:hypothetical protein